jgi:excinuclease ABC subunit C
MIKDKLIDLPKLPGIYIFKDQDNTIIYVGKAKALKRRVTSYFTKNHKDPRLCLLVKDAFDLDYIVTKTEEEAFLLEAQIVREQQPKYNIQLKEGQPYLYFMVSNSELEPVRTPPFAPTELHRGERKVENKSVHSDRVDQSCGERTINKEKDHEQKTVRGDRPRVDRGGVEAFERPKISDLPQFKLVRNKQEKGKYFGPVNRKWQARKAYEFLLKTFKLKLCNRKTSKGGCLDFHLGFCAGLCKEDFDREAYLFRLSLVQSFLKEDYTSAKAMIQDKITESNKHMRFEESKHLSEYLECFSYTVNTLKSCFTENKFASSIAYAASAMSKEKFLPSDIGQKLADLLGLDEPISTIDCFDISHFQSQYIVGSCVRFLKGIPFKSKFRRFKVKSLVEQNDYAALQEIVSRRYKDPSELPDLILIDGGKGQLSAVSQVLSGKPIISLAKREETLFYYKYMEGLKLDPKSDVGRLLMAIRDYAHHFAISYHRSRRDILRPGSG